MKRMWGQIFVFLKTIFQTRSYHFAMFFYDAFLRYVQNNRIDRTIFIRVCQCQNAKTVSVKSCISRSNKNIEMICHTVFKWDLQKGIKTLGQQLPFLWKKKYHNNSCNDLIIKHFGQISKMK